MIETYIYLGAANASFLILITKSKIFSKIRKKLYEIKFFNSLLKCIFCVSFYTSILLSIIMFNLNSIIGFILNMFCIVCFSNIFAALIYFSMSLLTKREEE